MAKPTVLVLSCVAPPRSSASTRNALRVNRCLLGALVFLVAALPAFGQTPVGQMRATFAFGPSSTGDSSLSPVSTSVPSSGSLSTSDGGAGAAYFAGDSNQRIVLSQNTKPFSAVGVGVHVGLNGAGFDVATPLSGKFNLRVGGDFFSYSDTFTTSGTNVTADLHLMSAHAALDWFPFSGRFRISPGVTLADNNRVRASAIIPAGSTLTLNGSDYTSSLTDPLHGSGSIDFRKTAPGVTVGFGNLVPRHGGHFSFPVDLGFIYVGQPRLKVDFSGSACAADEPPAIGCQPVDQYAEFQTSLTSFRNRINKDLDYANFYPVLSAGVGYSF